MYEHNALGYWSGLASCLTKVRSSRARCPATALITRVMNLHSYPISADLVFSFTFEENWYYGPVREKTNSLGSDQV